MKNYFIISKKNIQQLVLEVNEYIKSGSKCLGSPFQDNEKNIIYLIYIKSCLRDTTSGYTKSVIKINYFTFI